MLSDARWKAITESEFAWERNALEFLRKHLPDRQPYRAWTNFEFIADNGKVYEVDALILTPRGLFLVEIKSDLGTLEGDALTWTWTAADGRRYSKENPLLLANRKAKQLVSLLRRQKTTTKAHIYIEPIIYCSANGLSLKLSDSAAQNVYVSAAGPHGISEFLTREPDLTAGPNAANDHRRNAAIAQAVEAAGIRRSNRARRVGHYELSGLLAEGESWQDWLARNPDFDTVERRIRLYPYRLASTKAAREKLWRAVKREFDLLAGIEHPGILKPLDLAESDQGPALIFDYDPAALRLDHYLERYHSKLAVETRLHLMRRIAETVAYSHSKNIVHRALSPLAILVIKPDQARPEIKIFDWQTGFRRSAADPEAFDVPPTSHVEEMVDSAASAYIAPENFSYPDQVSESADIFSLGAIAYHVFSGQRPAENQLQLHGRMLDTHQGLQLAAVVDGANEHLHQLIAFSTDPEVSQRPDSVDEFVEMLDEPEADLLGRDGEEPDDPAEAREGATLPGGFTVKKRLGAGASSVALLVERDGQESVLKIAGTADDNSLLEQEAEVLRSLEKQAASLKHPGARFFPAFRGTPEVGGSRTAILMSSAGERTLARRLRDDGKLHIDMLARLGEQLLQAVDYLDRAGINHRDINPANIGVNEGSGGPLRLTLFDFSLSRVPPENIRAGTRPYLDPFLEMRKDKKWDAHAERFAAAMTLYEMATGALPRWGDGRSAAELTGKEATIDPELFDPTVRDGLSNFFTRALRRNTSERFESAEKMLEEWRRIFEHIDRTSSSSEGEVDPAAVEAAVTEARLDSAITLLPFTVRAMSVLQRLNVHRVSDLLAQRVSRLYRLSGVGNRTRREIAEMWQKLDQRLGHSGGGTDEADDDVGLRGRSIEVVLREVLTRKDSDDPVVQLILGMTAAPGEFEWPNERSVAERLEIQRVQVVEVLQRLRERWRGHAKSLNLLRDEICELLRRNGGVMAARELARDVLSVRGSANRDERIRSANASAVTRAAVEAERTLLQPRFALFRADHVMLVAENTELADWAQRLGSEADRMATADALLGSSRVQEELQHIRPPDSQVVRLAPHGLIELATTASRNAACNTSGEIYPRGMEAARALKLTRSALAGIDEISDTELKARVESRYPLATPCRSILTWTN